MAYSETINLVQGDTLPQLKITLRDQNTPAPGKTLDPEDPTTWMPLNLSGATVRMKIREVGDTALKDTITGIVLVAADGIAAFVFNPATLDTAGVYEAEVEYQSQTGAIQTVYDLIKLQVREQF
jgi:hypothetical protein